MHRRLFVKRGCVVAGLALGTGCLGPAELLSTKDNRSQSDDGDEQNSQETIMNTKFELGVDVPQDAQEKPSIEFQSSNQQVIIMGWIEVGNTCKTAILDSVQYDKKAGTLTVTVANTKKEDAGNFCGDVMGVEHYQVIITFAHELPKTVIAIEDGELRKVKTTAERTQTS